MGATAPVHRLPEMPMIPASSVADMSERSRAAKRPGSPSAISKATREV